MKEPFNLHSGTTTHIVVSSITETLIPTTTSVFVNEKITRWIGSTETEIGPHQYDEFNSNSESPTYAVNNNNSPNYSLNNLRKFIGKAHIPLAQRFEFSNLATNTEQSLFIVVAATFNDKPYGVRAISGQAIFPNGNTFKISGSTANAFKYFTYNKNIIKFIPQTKDVTLEIYSTVEDVKNHYFPDMYYADIVVSKVNFKTIDIVEKKQISENKIIDNPNSYPYTFDELTGKAVFYISQSPFATSTNPLDTPCTLNLKTCKTNRNNLTDILTNYQEKYNYNNTLEYTKYYPSSYYEYDSRGITTLNIPFNGKTISTYKYGKNNHTGNSGSAIQINCDNTNCPEYTELSYIHLNYLATPVILTDMKASTTEIIKTDSWGNPIFSNYNKDSNITTKIGYTNHIYDQDTDLTYAHARYLSTGRRQWLSLDPMSTDGFSTDYFLMNPQYQNSYSYASNNPVNNADPNGRAV